MTSAGSPTQYKGVSREVEDHELAGTPVRPVCKSRKKFIGQVSLWSRNRGSHQLVLQAYDHRCAITGLQLRLVDAAHILPVGAPGSTDQVANGIAMSPTYHRAFDRGLIYLDEEWRVRMNAPKVEHLESLHLGQGVEAPSRHCGHRILLPSNDSLRPAPSFIRSGNRFRGISA